METSMHSIEHSMEGRYGPQRMAIRGWVGCGGGQVLRISWSALSTGGRLSRGTRERSASLYWGSLLGPEGLKGSIGARWTKGL
jgi:hypothetical protein